MRLLRREERDKFACGPTETADQEMKALRTRLPVLEANLAKQEQETNSSKSIIASSRRVATVRNGE
jgi:hypothetical protein